MAAPTVNELYEHLIKSLPPTDRLRLVEKIIHDLSATTTDDPVVAEDDWMTLRGIAPHLLDGEDAQTWVSRTRQDADNHRVP